MVSSSTRSPAAMMPATLRPSSLPALTASRSMSPVEIAGTPRRPDRAPAWVPFPELGGPSRTTRRRPGSGSATPATDPAPLHEALVVAHHELALDLLDGVHRHADHDQQRGAAEVEVDPQAL